jgi:hypothetical protein
MIDWEKFRDSEGVIQLRSVFLDEVGFDKSWPAVDKANEYLRHIEEMCPVRSRQVAAVAIATAKTIVYGWEHAQSVAQRKLEDEAK